MSIDFNSIGHIEIKVFGIQSTDTHSLIWIFSYTSLISFTQITWRGCIYVIQFTLSYVWFTFSRFRLREVRNQVVESQTWLNAKYIPTDGSQYEWYRFASWALASFLLSKTTWSHLYSVKFVEWFFTVNYDMYENPIHLLINVDIFFIHYVFKISKKTNILKIAITIKVLGTLEHIFIVMQGSLFIVMQGSRGGGLKSNGVLMKFCLRAQWTPQNWRIGNVFQWRYPSNFAWGPWKFKWWEPRTLNKNAYREPCHDCIWYAF